MMELKLSLKLKLFFCLLICSIVFVHTNAQTTLSAGDIMFIGLNSDASGSPAADECALLFLEPVAAGTEIYFTDFGYTGNSSPYFQQNSNNGCTSPTGPSGDGMIKWTAPVGGVAAGQQLALRVRVTGSTPTANIGTVSIIVQTSSTGEGLNFTSTGDIVHAFQGTVNGSGQVTSATLLTSIFYQNGTWSTTVTTCQIDGGVSEDPATGYEVEYGGTEYDNGYYHGSLTGAKATLQAAILNMSNWTRGNSTTYTFPIVPPATTWNGSTWSNGTPTSLDDAIIASNTAPTTFTCNNLTINSGFSLNTGTSNTVTIHGDLTNNGNGVTGTGTITFTASGAASISGDTVEHEGTVIVESGCTLTTNSLLRLTSDASNTGRIGESDGTISGNVYVQRYMPGKRCFRFYGHPFSSSIALSHLTDEIDITGNGGSTNGFTNTTTNNPSAFWFDVTAADTSTSGANPGWTAFTSATSADWDRYELLRLFIRGAKGEGLTGGSYSPSAATFEAVGAINQGNQVITLTKGSSSEFVGCGNPFPSPVNMQNVARGANIGANYYAWDATSGASGAYVTNAWTLSYNLPAYTAFFTTVSANSNNTLTFEEQDKEATGTSLFKGTGPNDWVELYIYDSTTKWDRLLIHLNSNGMEVEDKLDGKKLYNPNLDFFSLSKDDVRLAVDVRPYEDQKSIPLGLTAYNRYNKYVIRTGMFNIPAGTKLMLHDKYLNKQEELKAGSEYWFDVTSDTASQGNNRFEINMEGKPTNIIQAATDEAQVQLIPNPAHKEVKVSFKGIVRDATIKLISITGLVLYSQTTNTHTDSIMIPLHKIPSGIYMVNITGKNISYTKKLIKE